MATIRDKNAALVGDWLEARNIYGGPPHRGQITAVIGKRGHRRYRVRWDEAHESLVYPTDGVSVRSREERS